MAAKEKRKLKDLNLLDKFLFDEAMEDEENMKTLLDIILGQDTHLKQPPQTEKECRSSLEKRQIRLDVYTVDEDDVVYDTEPQKTNTKNLPKRSRLYQGMIDSRLLPPGCIDFNLLNPVVIIMIMPFDLFGYELYRYTFSMYSRSSINSWLTNSGCFPWLFRKILVASSPSSSSGTSSHCILNV